MPRNVDRIKSVRPEQFVKEIVKDKDTDAAFLVYVVAHHEPGPEEMPTLEGRRLKMQIGEGTRRASLRKFFKYENVKERYGLVIKREEEEKKKGEEEKGAEQ